MEALSRSSAKKKAQTTFIKEGNTIRTVEGEVMVSIEGDEACCWGDDWCENATVHPGSPKKATIWKSAQRSFDSWLPSSSPAVEFNAPAGFDYARLEARMTQLSAQSAALFQEVEDLLPAPKASPGFHDAIREHSQRLRRFGAQLRAVSTCIEQGDILQAEVLVLQLEASRIVLMKNAEHCRELAQVARPAGASARQARGVAAQHDSHALTGVGDMEAEHGTSPDVITRVTDMMGSQATSAMERMRRLSASMRAGPKYFTDAFEFVDDPGAQ